MLDYSMRQDLLRGIIHIATRKRDFAAAGIAAAVIAFPTTDDWATEQRPAKRFKVSLFNCAEMAGEQK